MPDFLSFHFRSSKALDLMVESGRDLPRRFGHGFPMDFFSFLERVPSPTPAELNQTESDFRRGLPISRQLAEIQLFRYSEYKKHQASKQASEKGKMPAGAGKTRGRPKKNAKS